MVDELALQLSTGYVAFRAGRISLDALVLAQRPIWARARDLKLTDTIVGVVADDMARAASKLVDELRAAYAKFYAGQLSAKDYQASQAPLWTSIREAGLEGVCVRLMYERTDADRAGKRAPI